MPNRPKVRSQQGKSGGRSGGSRPQSGKSQGNASRGAGGRSRSDSDNRGRSRTSFNSKTEDRGRSRTSFNSKTEDRERSRTSSESESRGVTRGRSQSRIRETGNESELRGRSKFADDAGRKTRFDSDDRGPARRTRFDSDDRGPAKRTRFDSDDRGPARRTRFDSDDRGSERRPRFDSDDRGPRGRRRLGSDERSLTGRPRSSSETSNASGKAHSDDEMVTEDGTEMIFGKNAVLAFLENGEDAPASDSEFDEDDIDADPDQEFESATDEDADSNTHAATSKGDSKTEFVGPRGQVRKPEIGKIYLVQLDRPDRKIERIKQLAKSQRIPVVICDRRKLDSMVGPDQLHQGVAAQISAAEFWELSDFLDELKRSSPNSLDGNVVAIVDGIEDPHNLGAIIRVAESAGLKGLLLPARRSAGLTGIVAKTSAGALASLPIVRIHNLTQAVEELKESGFWIAGLDSNEGDLYTKTDLVRPLALVVGSEGTGMTRLVKENCDMLLKIPMLGKTESLNASVAAGIVFYEVVRQLQVKGMLSS